MVDIGHIQSSLIHELSTCGIGAFLACLVWYVANYFGFSYGVTSMVVVGAALMFTVIYDSKQFGSNPSTKTCTYEFLACMLILFAVCWYLGTSSFTGGPSAPSNLMGILYASFGMASVIACSRATYFAMIVCSRLELPSL